MEFIRGQHNLKPLHHGCVLTLGSFDGVHRAHQHLFDCLAGLGRELHLPTMAITFEPQPREVLQPQLAPPRLSGLRDKLTLLQRHTTLERLLCLHFNTRMAHLPADVFVEQLLVAQLGMRGIIIGDDLRFGHRGSGDLALLQQLGQRHGFIVLRRETLLHQGRRISSTWVREALSAGDLPLARTLLGHPHIHSARVIRGRQLGRTLGFPTANLRMGRRASPLHGVFAVRVHGLGPIALPAMANLGTRPTVGGHEHLLEVHLFDLNNDLYGRLMQVEFIERLRDEQRFESIDALRQQLHRDAEHARHVLQKDMTLCTGSG